MRALLSVADREGLAPLAAELLRLGVEVYATDGTREALAAEGVEVASVAVLTDVPALAGGQVKTFHPPSTPASWPAATGRSSWPSWPSMASG